MIDHVFNKRPWCGWWDSNSLERAVYLDKKLVNSSLSLKVTSNLRNTSILPKSNGTSSTWLHATLAVNSRDPRHTDSFFTTTETEDRPTPKTLWSLSSLVRVSPISLPTERGISEISAPESTYIHCGYFRSKITFATGRETRPKMLDRSFTYGKLMRIR